MEDNQLEFRVIFVPESEKLVINNALITRNYKIFLEIKSIIEIALGKKLAEANPNEQSSLSVTGTEHDTHVRLILQDLEKLGYRPVFQSLIVDEQIPNSFPVKRIRPDYPLDSSNWLMLMDSGCDGGEIKGIAESKLIVNTHCQYSRMAKKHGHCANILWCEFAVSQDFKDSFEKAGLRGATFRPVVYEPTIPNPQRIYWLDSQVTGPWSLSNRRVVWLEGHPGSGGILLGRGNELLIGAKRGDLVMDQEGLIGRGIDYNREEMNRMEGYDFFCMAEWMRVRGGIWRPYHIVSQKFRKWAWNFGCRLRMNGIRLHD